MGNAAATPATSTIKLLISKDAQVVLYAEAGKEVIDFLLGLLAMPAAAMIKHTTTSNDKDSPLGALAILYDSVERMEPEFMHSPEARDALLNPSPAHPALAAGAAGWFPFLIQPLAPPPPAVKVYECSQGGHNDCYNYVAAVENTPCRKCSGKMNSPKELHVSSGGGHGEALEAIGLGQAPAAAVADTGFVQGVATSSIIDSMISLRAIISIDRGKQ
ncbi:hypothetical protein HU200_055546 [Digitaria exilis]|uniref:Uncharacterized protein n=1 Tax=Digitaria exilis TaxID=1010633 RepID=A0A835AN95_9POAL|nr:hypothetical protein HU200_055546 [Digitaria exilis]